jgi:iron complex outermembrane recepter protein
MSFRKHSIVMLAAASTLAFASSAFAQEAATAPQSAEEAPGRGLEEIVVTARRTSERLINVPVAVTALSSATIERAHVSDLQQVAQLTPNLVIASAGSGTGGSISLRGVGTSFLDPGLEQSVGMNADGIAIGRGHFLLAAQFDLQQIEVLKGPQALFFGKNSPAGVISITSADPTPELKAMGRVGYEFEAKERYAEAWVAGPISETLGFRVAAKYSKLDGWFKNFVPAGQPDLAHPGFTIPGGLYKDGPGTEQLIGRVTLKWQPTTDFTANLKLTANRATGNSGDSPETYCVPGFAAANRGTQDTRSLTTGVFTVDPNSDCKLDHRTSRGQQPAQFIANWPKASKKGGLGYSEVKTYIGSLNLQYQMGPLSLTSITGYTKISAVNYSNASQDSFATVISTPSETGHTWSQEVRLMSNYEGPLNFTTGAFYEYAKRTNGFQPMLGFAGFDAANGGSAYTFENVYNNKGKTYSAYGQLRWKIIEELELSGGVRYTKEKKDSEGVNLYLNALGRNFGLAPVGTVLRNNLEFSNWSPEMTLRYKPSNNVMTYVAYKTGYKSGGVSNPATISNSYVADPSVLQFRPERSKGFEAGVKAELLGRTLRYEGTIYRYTFTDLQLTSFNADLVAYFIRNAGKARTSGAESSLTWQVSPEFSLNGGAAYNKAKFVDFQGAQCPATRTALGLCPQGFYDRSGQPLPRAPKWTLSGGFNYDREIGSDLKVGVTGDAIRTSSYVTSETGDRNVDMSGYWRLNANVRLGAADDTWQLTFYGRNLTNKYITVIGNDKVFSSAGQVTMYSLRPRELGLEATYRF